MNEHDVILWAEEKGLQDGEACAPYRPPTRPGLVPDADDAYNMSYWHALAYYSTSTGWRVE